MGIIPQSKFGKCSQCNDTDVPCVKVESERIRDKCHKNNKAKQQMAKASEKRCTFFTFISKREWNY